MSRTILIVGIDYWPDVTGPAPYTTQFAEYLAEQGDDVHVLTGMPYYPEWRIKHGYDRKLRLTETRNGVTLHRRRQYIPRKQSALHRAGYEGTFLAQSVLPPKTPRPELVIGVIPALADGMLAARLAKKYDAPLSLWVQDLMGQAASQSGVSGGQRIAHQTARIEGWIARQARSVGIIAEGFRPHLEAMGVSPDRIHHTPNWTHIGRPTMTQEEARLALGLPLDRKICLHAGNMGLKQGLDNVVEAARLSVTEAPELFFVLLGDGSQRQMLERLGQGIPNLRFMDPVSEAMLPNTLNSADILLACQRQSVVDMSLPSKLTSYSSTSKPIVGIGDRTSAMSKEIIQGGGQVFSSQALGDLLRHLRNVPDRHETKSSLPTISATMTVSNLEILTTLQRTLGLSSDTAKANCYPVAP